MPGSAPIVPSSTEAVHVAVGGVHVAEVQLSTLMDTTLAPHHQNPSLLPLGHHVGDMEETEDVEGVLYMPRDRGPRTSPCYSPRIPLLAPLGAILLSPRRKTEEPT